jgi:hypothetical protein
MSVMLDLSTASHGCMRAARKLLLHLMTSRCPSFTFLAYGYETQVLCNVWVPTRGGLQRHWGDRVLVAFAGVNRQGMDGVAMVPPDDAVGQVVEPPRKEGDALVPWTPVVCSILLNYVKCDIINRVQFELTFKSVLLSAMLPCLRSVILSSANVVTLSDFVQLLIISMLNKVQRVLWREG